MWRKKISYIINVDSITVKGYLLGKDIYIMEKIEKEILRKHKKFEIFMKVKI